MKEMSHELFHLLGTFDGFDIGLVMFMTFTLSVGIGCVYKITKKSYKDDKETMVNSIIMTIILFLICVVGIAYSKDRHTLLNNYTQALEYEENGNDLLAYGLYKDLYETDPQYEDVDLRYHYLHKKINYSKGQTQLVLEDYLGAYRFFCEASDYLDSDVLSQYCYYMYIMNQHPNWTPDMEIPRSTR